MVGDKVDGKPFQFYDLSVYILDRLDALLEYLYMCCFIFVGYLAQDFVGLLVRLLFPRFTSGATPAVFW